MRGLQDGQSHRRNLSGQKTPHHFPLGPAGGATCPAEFPLSRLREGPLGIGQFPQGSAFQLATYAVLSAYYAMLDSARKL